MSHRYMFHAIARVPAAGDNTAIASRRLEAGDEITLDGETVTLDATVLEGHRFAIVPIPAGAWLLSWGLPFGVATHDIAPGGYVCNASTLKAIRGRQVKVSLPAEPNFADRVTPYTLDEAQFQPAAPMPRSAEVRTFMGYRRSAARGVGTRNFVLLLGVTSAAAGFVTQLERRLRPLAANYANVDGIVAIAHTEGSTRPANNLDRLLRALAGFVVHPNVGAALLAGHEWEPVTYEHLRGFMLENGYPMDEVPHHALALSGNFADDLRHGEAIVAGWLEAVNATPRTAESVSHLRIALQCGGSDAFSGISGNPLAAWVAREVIRLGGSANLAETPELIGAETYVLEKVKDLDTARRFLAMVERFKELAAWHGASAEGNPSGGNKFRGLYNIVLKSIGAAMKRHPDVRLDEVIEYGERMRAPGFYFMDSPGLDLESVAGQVAAGCNLIFFTTGNGSITNFPFVPTMKFVTTTRRYQLLSQEMDVNAGAFLDGTPMDALGQQTFDLALEIASGQASAGEKAGHAQVQIWRNWQQTRPNTLAQEIGGAPLGGRPIPVHPEPARPGLQFPALHTENGPATDQVGLILPTSLCSAEIARLAAEALNRKGLGPGRGISRFVALPHTEGCTSSGDVSEQMTTRTLLGYLTHPLVRHALLLEHGCEIVHNDRMHHELERLGLDPHQFGWASIQADGGIARVMQKMEDWFAARSAESSPPPVRQAGIEALRVGLLPSGTVTGDAAASLGQLTRTIVGAGGMVVMPQNTPLLTTSDFQERTLTQPTVQPSLAYGQHAAQRGFHIMEAPTVHWDEALTGLGATGVEIILAYIGEHPAQGHPLIPVVQATAEASVLEHFGNDMDLQLAETPETWAERLLLLLIEVAARRYTPKLQQQGNTAFQLTRGWLGLSL